MSSLNQYFPFNNYLVRRFLNSWKQEDEHLWRQKAVDALSSKLKKQPNQQFNKLQLALEKKNRETPCVLLPRSQDGRLQVLHKKMLPHVMCCRIFRWPDLQSHQELKSLPNCQHPFQKKEGPEICVNPYHYARTEHVQIYPPGHRDMQSSNASPPPLSPLSPGSDCYSRPQFQNSPTYFSTASTSQNPIFQSTQNQLESPNQTFYSNQLPLSETNGWYGGTNGIGPNSLTYETQSPPPVYTKHDPQQLAQMPMDVMDDTHHMSSSFHSSDEPWCRIKYAELNQVIGEDFKGSSREVIVDGYTNPSVHNRRFSLCQLSSVNRSSRIEQTRSSIGRGICLENNDGQIYVTNLSEYSIFFQSKNRNQETKGELGQHTVIKVLPQQKEKIFDQNVFEVLVQEAMRSGEKRAYERLSALIEHCNIKMSFVKGWGVRYKAADVTSTPCWIEIQLLKPCKLLDQHIRFLTPSNNITSTS